MDVLKDKLATRLNQLGQSFTSNEDAMMDDMSDFVLSPYEYASTSADPIEPVQQKKPQTRSLPRIDPSNDDEVIDNIDASYFIEDDFDAIGYELRKLPPNDLYVEDLERERVNLKGQLQVVSKKISALILVKSPTYSGQMEGMSDIREELGELIAQVRTIRRALGQSKEKSTNALMVLANEKRKKMLRRLKATLLTIKTLHETEYQLRDLIEEGKFPIAIELCSRAQEAANTYRQFNCVSDLMSKLSGTTNLIEAELDKALSALTVHFDHDRYSYVHSAYSMLGRQESAAQKLAGFFCATLDSSARSVLEERVRHFTQQRDTEKMTFEELAQSIDIEQLTVVMKELGLVLCKVLSIYHSILRFHIEDDERLSLASGDQNVVIGVIQSTLTAKITNVFKSALWLFTTLLNSHDISHLKFDHILDVVDMVNRFRRFGRLYFAHPCGELAQVLEKQTISYFIRYHRERVDELRMFLENEIFALCPVPYQFTIFDLQEFQFLKEVRTEEDFSSVEGEVPTHSVMGSDTPNPFGKEETDKAKRRTISHASSCSVDESNDLPTPTTHRDLEPNYEEPADHIPPNLCNTALNLLRFFGRYIRMTSLIPAISEKSIPAVTQLFNYFFYSIFAFFGKDGTNGSDINPGLKRILHDIKYYIISEDGEGQPSRIPPPSLSCAVQLQYPDQLFAATERIMAVESLEFVARQLDLMRPVIDSLVVTENEKLITLLDSFYSQILPVVPLTRTLIFSCIASKALKYPVLVNQVAQTAWDLNDLQSQHSPYVDFLLQDMEMFSRRLDNVALCVSISDNTRSLLWDRVIYYGFHALVQGYCETSGKCSSEGRALMQLDLQHLLGKIELLSGLKPVPHQAYVDGYIKAYYLPESSLEQWVLQHSEYTSRQMVSLLGVASHVSKKAKTRIINALNS